MGIIIRLADPDKDYDAVASLWNELEPEPVTADELREWDAPAPGKLRRRMAAFMDGRIAGYSFVARNAFDADGRYQVWVGVSPRWQRQGIGGQLYDEALRFAKQQAASKLTTDVRDNNPDALRFAEQRGFAISHHRFESILDLHSFDANAFVGVVEDVSGSGIQFTNLAEEGDSEEARRKLYQLNCVTYLDEPGNSGDFPDFETFNKMLNTARWFRAAGQILAIHEKQYVGISAVGYFANTNSLYNLMTGVDRAYRGRHIALAMKLLTIQYGQAIGADYMRTHNDSRNAPMLAINRKLGYQPRPGEYRLFCLLS